MNETEKASFLCSMTHSIIETYAIEFPPPLEGFLSEESLKISNEISFQSGKISAIKDKDFQIDAYRILTQTISDCILEYRR